ncbi:Hypothetical protein SCF082_LOCUS46724 [Durusdinium trenchii]|uniref:FZ domain-containing protein n=1 Tax=Durusdinium trenchii TaxID=1381693 RepID=A0ABP0RGR3_9DINO
MKRRDGNANGEGQFKSAAVELESRRCYAWVAQKQRHGGSTSQENPGGKAREAAKVAVSDEASDEAKKMKRFALLVAAAAALVPQATALSENPWGRCETYNASGWCANGKAGTQVWIHDGFTQEQQEASLAIVTDFFSRISTVGSANCQTQWMRMYCDQYFPPCTTVNDASDNPVQVPQRQCQSQCTLLQESCADGFAVLTAAGLSFLNPHSSCADTINTTSRIYAYYYPDYLDQWTDRPIFQAAETETLTTPSNGNVQVPCATIPEGDFKCSRRRCVLPYLEVSRATIGDDHSTCQDYSTSMSSCVDCTSSCELPCPLQVWSDQEWNVQWILRWLPGVFSIPLNAVTFGVEAQKLRNSKANRRVQANMYLLYCAMLGLLFAMFDSIPVMFAKFDMKCQGRPAHGTLTDDWTPYCAIGRFSIHILHMLLGSVGVVLHQLYFKLSAASKMRQGYKQSRVSKILSHMWIFGLPVAMIIAHAAQPISDGMTSVIADDGMSMTKTDMKLGNFLRYGFSCGPRFEDQGTEWALIMVPSIVYGVFLIVVSTALVRVVHGMSRSSSAGSRGAKSAKRSNLNLAKKMLRFAVVCVGLVVLNLGAVIPFLSLALDAANEMELWNGCAVSGIIRETCPPGQLGYIGCNYTNVEYDNLAATEARCGSSSDFAPSPVNMMLVHLSYSAPALAFGVLFGFSSFRQLIKKGAAKVGAATSMASTSHASVAK